MLTLTLESTSEVSAIDESSSGTSDSRAFALLSSRFCMYSTLRQTTTVVQKSALELDESPEKDGVLRPASMHAVAMFPFSTL